MLVPPMLVLPLSAAPAAAVQLIIDTDMAGDVDDVGALCLAHALADRGEAAILERHSNDSCRGRRRRRHQELGEGMAAHRRRTE